MMYVQFFGVLSTEGVFSTVEDILKTVGNLQYRGGYLSTMRAYIEYHRECSVPWGLSEYHESIY